MAEATAATAAAALLHVVLQENPLTLGLGSVESIEFPSSCSYTIPLLILSLTFDPSTSWTVCC